MQCATADTKKTSDDLIVPPWFQDVGGVHEKPTLRVIDAQGSRLHLLTQPSHLLVGRGQTADISVGCDRASRRHALLHVDDHVALEDLGSLNGTMVSGVRLVPGMKRVLQTGDVALVGSSALVLGSLPIGEAAPLLVSPDALTNLSIRSASSGGVIAVFGFTVSQSVDADWLATLFANIFGPRARLADWGNRSWRLAYLSVDEGKARVAAKSAVARLAFCGLTTNPDIACFPLSTKEGEMARHSIFVSLVAPRSGPHIIGRSKKMADLVVLAEKVSDSPLSIVLLGETGVGKELVASLIHERSRRRDKPLVRLNCATLGESLLESELFGYEAGAFTGAGKRKIGLLETADGGTVFLDEVVELPLGVQAKLLRVVEAHQFMRVGGTRLLPIDVRFVAATNRDLWGETKAGRFRQDLYFRLAGIVLQIPALRDRPDDIPLLARAFLDEGGAADPAVSQSRLWPSSALTTGQGTFESCAMS